jgi:hypothetical protein
MYVLASIYEKCRKIKFPNFDIYNANFPILGALAPFPKRHWQ